MKFARESRELTRIILQSDSSWFALAALLSAALLLSGCLSRPALKRESFNFAVPQIKPVSSSENERVLGVRSVDVASAYQGRPFVYRTGDSSYERDPYAEFFVSPAESLLNAVRGSFREGGLFQSVADRASLLKPNTLLEIHVSQLYGDFRDPKQAAGVLSIRFVFFDAPNETPGSVLFQKSYSRRIPFKTRTAAALMTAWNEALTQILTDLAADLKKRNL